MLAVSMLSRCLRGVPDDLTWRLLDARRLPGPTPAIALERTAAMAARPLNVAFFAIVTGMAWAAVLVMAIEPVAQSLSYAGVLLALVALTAWTLEARGMPDDEAAPTAWPLLLSVGIVAVAGGLVFDGGRIGLLLSVPSAFGLSLAFVREMTASAAVEAEPGTPRPLPPSELALHASRGEVIAIERTPERGVTRRALLRGGFGLGMASVLAAMGGIVVDFLWQRNVAGFGGVVTAGKVEEFPPGTKTVVRAGKFWLVNLTPEQGGPGFLALWQKCPHLGCVVPWEPRFSFVDPRSGDHSEGWFRCPCHQSTYDHAGVRVYGPAPRSMDRMALTVTKDGYIEVDTGDISKGIEDNAVHAVRG
jgi:cytochrome b6-f complex iron-sulfur subunit